MDDCCTPRRRIDSIPKLQQAAASDDGQALLQRLDQTSVGVAGAAAGSASSSQSKRRPQRFRADPRTLAAQNIGGATGIGSIGRTVGGRDCDCGYRHRIEGSTTGG